MRKPKRLVLSLSAIFCVIVAVLVISPFDHSNDPLPMLPPPNTGSDLNLGVTYLPLNSTTAASYKLATSSGALVTKVAPRSLAEKAGLQTGDVILSFNGISLDEENPLLGVLQTCYNAQSISMEVLRDDSIQVLGCPCQ